MILPKTNIEKNLIKKRAGFVVGVDEAGRGPLAGPVVAGAVWVRPEALEKEFELRNLIRDSKTLSEKQRMKIFEFIFDSDAFELGIGEVSHQMIDRINILNASLLAMRLAAEELFQKISQKEGLKKENTFLLVDGNKKIPGVTFEQKIFAKGDRNIFSIAAASIVAKVHRDSIMKKHHEDFPEYGFDAHKGYGTRIHMRQLALNGPCEIHRRSFGPVREALE